MENIVLLQVKWSYLLTIISIVTIQHPLCDTGDTQSPLEFPPQDVDV